MYAGLDYMIHNRGFQRRICHIVLIILLSNTLMGCNTLEKPTPYDMCYEITPISSLENILHITLRLDNLSSNNKMEFYTGDKLINIKYCRNDMGQAIPCVNSDGVLSIFSKGESYIEISYDVKIGIIGKHGYRGMICDDLVVFDGGQVLLFPIAFYMEGDDPSRDINSISMVCNVPEAWEKVYPYETITSPSWHELYALYNSCFAFGDMDKKEYKKGQNCLRILTDWDIDLSDEMEQGLNSLYEYYAALFGYEINDYTIVLLRHNPQDMQYIIGGAGAKSVGSTFDPANPRDWQLMSHRMFHAFFESKVPSKIFLKPPQLWFYEGLVTYYENCSMDSLPEGLKDSLALQSEELFSTLFKKYIYTRIKYHPLLSLSPMDEERIMDSPAKMEFLHYTQAPLIIKAIEDLTYKTQGPHRILNYILENKSNDESLYIKNILADVLEDKAEGLYEQYISGDELLPLWYLGSEQKAEDVEHIIKELNHMEYTLWSWFRLDYGDYPNYTLDAETINRLSGSKEVCNVHFADRDIEEKVLILSKGVYYALKEFVLKCDICSVASKDPIAKIKALESEEKVAKWKTWKDVAP